jgi:hypothetical protein
MPITTGNFQDLVQLSLDTLYYLGPDLELGNSASASTVSVGFQNTAGEIQLAAAASAAGTVTVWLPSNSGTLIENINLSAGTTSNNLTAVTFANSNNNTWGLNASTVTISAPVNFSAGTTSNNLTQVSFSNGSGVTFGLNAGTITASINALTAINVSAGTTSNNLTAFTLSNSNGLSFGINASTITAKYGGFSSWSNGDPATALTGGQNTLFFQPIIVPYAMTVSMIEFLASISNVTNSSGGFSLSAALYTLNGGSAGTFSLASSGSSNITWTSGAALSSNTGINYQSMSVNSWSITPGPYLFAWWLSTQAAATVSYYGPPAQPVIASNRQSAMSALAVNGYSQATTNALPTSFGITNTASYIRTGATAAEQPYFIFQGT